MRVGSRRILLWMIVCFGVVAIAMAAWMVGLGHSGLSGPPEHVRLGTVPAELSALIWVAESRGYFLANGLNVTIQMYESGHLALKDLVAGNQDFVTVTDFPVAEYSLQKPGLRVLASIDMCDTVRLIARGDSQIRKPSDLKGKRVGVAIGSVAEFFLARLLTMSGVAWQDVRIVDLLPAQQTEAIRNHEIDAAIPWEPFARKMMELLGPDTVALPGQNGQDLYWLLVCTGETLAKRSSGARRFVSALLKAEDFLDSDEAAAQAIVARRLDLDKRFVESDWGRNRFGVTLGRPLVLTMEDQCRWLMARNRLVRPKMPNFPQIADVRGLKALRPEAVSIIPWDGLHDH